MGENVNIKSSQMIPALGSPFAPYIPGFFYGPSVEVEGVAQTALDANRTFLIPYRIATRANFDGFGFIVGALGANDIELGLYDFDETDKVLGAKLAGATLTSTMTVDVLTAVAFSGGSTSIPAGMKYLAISGTTGGAGPTVYNYDVVPASGSQHYQLMGMGIDDIEGSTTSHLEALNHYEAAAQISSIVVGTTAIGNDVSNDGAKNAIIYLGQANGTPRF